MGQSNADFLGTGGEWGVASRVFVWNNEGNVTSGNGDTGDRFHPADFGARPFHDGCNNMFAHTADLLHRRTGKDVRLILVARGSSSIVRWNNDGVKGQQYLQLEAILAASGVESVDALLWHQGESDNLDGRHILYEDRFDGMLELLDADGILSDTAPVVIGSVVPDRTNINPVLAGLVGGRVRLADVGVLDTFDGTHFAGYEARPGGALYEAELADLLGL